MQADDKTITCSPDYKFMHELESDINNSVAEIWAVTNILPICVDIYQHIQLTFGACEYSAWFVPDCAFLSPL